MPNSLQAKKRVRQTLKRTETNRSRKSRVRSFAGSVERAIEAGDKNAAQEALQAAQPEIMRGVTKGVLHKNTASRKISRLARRISAMPD